MQFCSAYCNNIENNEQIKGKHNYKLGKLFTLARLVCGQNKIYEPEQPLADKTMVIQFSVQNKTNYHQEGILFPCLSLP